MTPHYALARLRAAAGRRMMPAMQNPNSTRTSALRRAAPQWKRQLLDVTGRNRLLNYRDLKSGTIDLTPAPDSGMDARVLNTLLVGKPVRMTALFPVGDGDEDMQKDARKRFSAIHKQARETWRRWTRVPQPSGRAYALTAAASSI